MSIIVPEAVADAGAFESIMVPEAVAEALVPLSSIAGVVDFAHPVKIIAVNIVPTNIFFIYLFL